MEERKGLYKFNEIEKKWQQNWEAGKTFKAADSDTKPKYYALDMFPYPSAQGLHVGHPEGYTASDIVARYKRMKGFNVMHPIGWDAFGLPAEQYAIKTGTHPAQTTQNNVDGMRKQIKSLGFSYDWDREVNTTDPNYYKWTQWIFLNLFNCWFDEKQQKARPIKELPIPAGLSDAEKRRYVDDHRLAYEAEMPVNWCPALGTVLANEEVVGGVSERGGHPVIRKPLRQWLLRITEYAERLLGDLVEVDWPEPIKEMQRNWIGKSIGAEVDFKVAGSNDNIRVFTTRPDTLFGATYMVLAPEHPLVDVITTKDKKDAVKKYREEAARKSDLDRTDLAKEKTGEFTGAYAINPVNETKIPIWISDYVLISYGTGAIMAVPAHDDRDFEFAKKFNLAIIQVVNPPEVEQRELVKQGKLCFTGDGVAINSGQFTGLKTPEFKERISKWLEEKGLGKKAVNYKLRDWLFSRQRYWGEPIPLVHCEKCGIVGLPESVLPLKLPDMQDYTPPATGEPPLSKAKDWLKTTCPQCGGVALRETNTMPQWAGSCWYYLRYIDPNNNNRCCDGAKEKYWMPVDLYIGGAEHAVLHLLYSRFWHKFLFDIGYVSTKEPFKKLVNQGMILGEDGQKMSKSRGNVVNPDKVVADYGADSMRLYEMFMGPLEAVKPWSMQGVEGVHRFLQRVWRLIINEDTGNLNAVIQNASADEATTRLLHQTIQKVGGDVETFGFNTAISSMMILVNHLIKQSVVPKAVVEQLVLILSPFAPHIAEELWQKLGHSKTLAYEPWPKFDPELVKEAEIELAIQVNGKIKDKIVVPAQADDEQIKQKALASEKVIAALAGKQPKKVIVIKSRLVNIVV
jgi:leucyl-tRNA synthetase